MDDVSQGDICRVCRCEAQPDRPLFYPCICTGSIKYIHQDCLMQWMRYSHKEYCELCGHRFSFQPIYAPDMPRVLPVKDVIMGLISAIMKGAKSWFHYSLVGIAWFGVVPLSAYRTYRYLFRVSSFELILSLPFDIFSTENLATDAFRGCFVVTCTLLSFIGLVWLREQILHGGGPDWLERDDAPAGVMPNVDGEAERDVNERAARVVRAALAVGHGPNPAAANVEAPRDVPMNNAAPAVVNAADNEGEQPLVDNVDAPNAAPGAGAGAANAAENDNDEPNWNPMEWDRAAEELTWERLLGLDGSLVFLEHVFWIISLNTMFIFTFAFCPYCVGNFILSSLDILQPSKPLLHFHGLLTTLFGYCCIGVTLVVMHFFARVFRLKRMRWLIGLCYIVVKVSLLSVVEIGVLPLVCGWWLDICSLPLFDASIKDRKANFKAAPGTSLFVHWMFGMIYVYYFAALVNLMREVLRPGVLWIFRNVNDPDFSPIQEMIHVPILRHARRLIASAMIFGCSVLLILYVPIAVLKYVLPNFLPYTLSGDADVNDLSVQLMILQIIIFQIVLPGFFEQTHTRIWLKASFRFWCLTVSWILGIRSYLLGNEDQQDDEEEDDGDGDEDEDEEDTDDDEVDVEDNDDRAENDNVNLLNAGENAAGGAAPQQANQRPPVAGQQEQILRNLGAEHRANRQRDAFVPFQPYDRPTLFPLRLCGLLLIMCFSIVISAMIILTVPIYIGRKVLSFWGTANAAAIATEEGEQQQQQVDAVAVAAADVVANAATLVDANVNMNVNANADGGAANVNANANGNVGRVNTARPHELYTAELGAYLCWLVTRVIALILNLLPQGRAAIVNKVKLWLRIASEYALPVFTFMVLLIIVPLLFGLLLELVVVIPLRVPIFQTPLHFLWQDWALGVLYTKIAIALTLMGPDWAIKRAIERAYRDGLRDIDIKFVINELAMPVITAIGLALAIPYVLAQSIAPIFIKDPFARLSISRLVYPMSFILIGSIVYVMFEIKQFKKLYMSIKVDKYLVGQRLVNYEHRKKQQEAKDAKAAEEAKAAQDATAAQQAQAETQAKVEAAAETKAIIEVAEAVDVVSAVIAVEMKDASAKKASHDAAPSDNGPSTSKAITYGAGGAEASIPDRSAGTPLGGKDAGVSAKQTESIELGVHDHLKQEVELPPTFHPRRRDSMVIISEDEELSAFRSRRRREFISAPKPRDDAH